MLPPPPSSTLFPYTTLFRSLPPIPMLDPFHPQGVCAQYSERHGAIDASLETTTSVGCDASTRQVAMGIRSEEHTSELQSQSNLVCRLLLEKKKKINKQKQLT